MLQSGTINGRKEFLMPSLKKCACGSGMLYVSEIPLHSQRERLEADDLSLPTVKCVLQLSIRPSQ